MADTVSQDQCETRRLHCSEALTSFLVDLRKELAPLALVVTRHDEQLKELRQSQGRLRGFFYGLLGTILAGVVTAVICYALKVGG